MLYTTKKIEFNDDMLRQYDIKNWINENGWVNGNNNGNLVSYIPYNHWYLVNGDP